MPKWHGKFHSTMYPNFVYGQLEIADKRACISFRGGFRKNCEQLAGIKYHDNCIFLTYENQIMTMIITKQTFSEIRGKYTCTNPMDTGEFMLRATCKPTSCCSNCTVV